MPARRDDPPPSECDLAVVGGGILGMAVARELSRRQPGAPVCVLEAEPRLGYHQTGRSSGVIHAGIYYEPGSLKARLCVEGARRLYAYCEERDIPHRRSGQAGGRDRRDRARRASTSSSGAAGPTGCPA